MVKSMRPTIPIVDWKIAVDLKQTSAIQQHPLMSATNCNCDFCKNWLLVFKEVLPAYLIHQLERLGISPQHPADSYGSAPKDGEVEYRVWYYVVGKILSGPNGWKQDQSLGEIRNYIALSDSPRFLSLVIQQQKQFHDQVPDFSEEVLRDLIQIDFRLSIPWVIN
jgi:hypothetical protein